MREATNLHTFTVDLQFFRSSVPWSHAMYRTLAIIMLVLGVLLVGISSLSYAHMRQIVLGTSTSSALEQVDVRIMTIGMVDNGATVDAAAYCRQLTMRVYAVFGAGLGLLTLSGGLFTRPRNNRREQSDE